MGFMSSLPSILLVEDNLSIAETLAHALKGCYQMDIAASGLLAIYKADSESYDIVVLDLNLPDMSGLDVCQQLREQGQVMPILILTAEAGILTKIKLLDAGANDYVTKPFSLGELKARLRALARPTVQPIARADNELVACGLILNRGAHTVIRDSQEIKLRRKEFALLECLMKNAGTVVSRTTLSQFAWHGSDKPWTNTVDVHIKHLRDKIDRPFASSLIKTVHGVGYKLIVPAYEVNGQRL